MVGGTLTTDTYRALKSVDSETLAVLKKEDNDFHKIGRACLEEAPALFLLLRDHIKDYQDNSIEDISLINAYFHYFCNYKQIEPDELRTVVVRTTLPVISLRRLFIGIIISEFDKLFLANYTGRMKDGVRKNIADCLNACPEWISNVANSVKIELSYLKGYEAEINTAIEAIQPLVHSMPADMLPEYANTRHLVHQFNLFE